MIDLYKTYNKAKEVFVKPKLHWYFGTWKNDPCLPVWRRGPVLKIAKRNQVYNVNDQVMIKTGQHTYHLNGKEHVCNHYSHAFKHKLPNNVGVFNLAWIRPIRKKLKKFRLNWLKPSYKLPIWLSFYIFNHDVIWKTKYDEIRYEYPPQFTIVFFGLSLSFWLSPEIHNDTESPTHYWESLLSYLYGKYPKDLLQTIVSCGKWMNCLDGKENSFFQVSKNYIKPEYHKIYQEAEELYEELKNKKEYV